MSLSRHLIVVNPRAGSGRALEASWRVEALYREAGLDFALAKTSGPGDATALAREGASQFAAVVAVGGDGTVHEVANGLADAAAAAGDPARVAALATIPIGTGNDFVKSLDVPPLVEAGFEVVRAGRRRRIDLGRAGPLLAPGRKIAREWFCNDFSAGYGALVVKDMAHPPGYLRFLTGHLAYLAVGLRRMFHRPDRMRLELDGASPREANFYEIHVGNGRFCGGGIQFTPRAAIDDGLLDVTTIHTISRWKVIPTLFFDVRAGTLAPMKGVDFARTTHLAIEQPQGFPVYVDGEWREVEPPAEGRPARVEVEVAPGALDVLAPAT